MLTTMYEYYVRDEHMQHTEIAAIKFYIYSIIENKRARYKKFMLLIDFCVRRKEQEMESFQGYFSRGTYNIFIFPLLSARKFRHINKYERKEKKVFHQQKNHTERNIKCFVILLQRS